MAWTQPSREFVAKIVELSNFAADFVLGHVLLFCQLPILCFPMADKFHSIMLFWLKPSRQIRPPIYSLKQTRLRKRMIRKYCSLYFLVLIVFAACIVGPAVAASRVDLQKISDNVDKSGNEIFHGLIQPRRQKNNDTGHGMSTYKGHFFTKTPSIAPWSTKA